MATAVPTEAAHDHSVQFYETDEFLAEHVARYMAEGLRDGDAGILIATRPHRKQFAARLAALSIDVDRELSSGRLVMLDALETLEAFMVDGVPDPSLFETIIGAQLAVLGDGDRPIRAYGEMVDVLWRSGLSSAALQLENLWNGLRQQRPFSLLCAYALDSFYKDPGISAVCATHAHVHPPERAAVEGTSHLVASVHTLVAEIARRTELEEALREALRSTRIAEKEARAAKEDIEDFLENAPVAIHRVDRDGIIRWANAAELTMLGYTRDEYVGRHVAELHVDADVIEDILARLQRGDAIRDQKTRVRTKAGAIRVLEITSNAQHREGELVTTRCFSHDITALEEADVARQATLAATQAARAAAEDANQAKDQFLAMLGHELRNPLSPILTAVQLMKLRGEASTREHEIIERQISHLIHLVDDLLDISRIARGKLAIERRRLRLSEQISRALEICAPPITERRHAVTVQLPDEELWVDADETRLCQVLTNLIGNAVKYTPAGGKIAVSVAREGKGVAIRVVDNGAGIAAELLPQIFEPFVQGRRTSSRSQGGLGIGLALVQTIVTLHGGTVAATSAGAGRGTELVVRLPLVEAQHAAPTTRRILVVDDNEDAGMLMGDLLRSIGHVVEVAIDGRRALEVVDVFVPEIAILDIGLPDMDGYELAAALRDRLPRVRMLALTGYGQAHDRTRAHEAGFDAHFVKPVSVANVLAALEMK